MKKYKLRDRLVFEWHNDWKQFKGKYNWISMNVIYVYFEKDNWIGGWEFWFVVLGFGLYIRMNNDKALGQFEKWDKELKKRENKKKLK